MMSDRPTLETDAIHLKQGITHAEYRRYAQRLERERDNALSDFRQADTDSIRALHERNEARGQRDALAEALQEMRYGHTDKAEEMAIEALNYLTK